MPSSSVTSSAWSTLAVLCLLFLAFFPNLLYRVLLAPLTLLLNLANVLAVLSRTPSGHPLDANNLASTLGVPLTITATSIATCPAPGTYVCSYPSGTTSTRDKTIPDDGIPARDEMSGWFQKTLTLPARGRGSYLITDAIEGQLPELRAYRVGILHLFVQHTSCALSMNENWDDDVRADMSDALDRIVPEDDGRSKTALYRHSAEGRDDMPAHVKSALVGSSVTIPITNGKLATGTWQGIWLLEFRTAKHQRRLVATIQGEKSG